jgi:hypothetical protein
MATATTVNSAVTPTKTGWFGGTGSGKTTTAARLAIGISKHLHNRAPVYVYDTEPGWQFMRRAFQAEGIELIQERQRSFKGMVEHIGIAEKRGACVFVVDSMTHVWTELMETFANKYGRVEFQSFNLIKKNWNNWTVKFLNSPMHCMALGRLGFDYDTIEKEDDRGKVRKEIVKGDSKFKAGGGESFGYEPHLLIEMELEREGAQSGRGGKLIHTANVLKDRANVLNGEVFEFKDGKGYAVGDYELVYKTFLPHIEELQYVEGNPTLVASSSSSLVPDDNGDYARRQKSKEIALEDWDATMQLLFPGQDAPSKKIRQLISQEVFKDIRSRTEIETQPLETIQGAAKTLRMLEARIKGEKMPSTPDGIMAELSIVQQQMREELAEQVF